MVFFTNTGERVLRPDLGGGLGAPAFVAGRPLPGHASARSQTDPRVAVPGSPPPRVASRIDLPLRGRIVDSTRIITGPPRARRNDC